MESQSAIETTAPDPNFDASPSTQPTYTTAGTIYKPSTSQPLQPPARRGRSFKYAGGLNSDLSLFPRSALSSLSLRGLGTRLSAFQQYTPLQQNYDRAVSPPTDIDHILATSASQPSGPLPGLLKMSLVDSLPHTASTLDKMNDRDDDSEDNDSDLGSDPLSALTTKSLQNLASYPNPNQTRARKVLNRGNKMLSAGNTLSRPASSVASLNGLPTIEEPTGGLNALSNGKLGYSNEGNTSSPSVPGHQDLKSDHQSQQLEPQIGSLIHNTLASGPGAPRPLTAGPPGQRQYRPATFESTFRALQSKQAQLNGAKDTGHCTSSGQSVLGLRGLLESNLDGGVAPFVPQASRDSVIHESLSHPDHVGESLPERSGIMDRVAVRDERHLLRQAGNPEKADEEPLEHSILHKAQTREEQLRGFEKGTDRLSSQLMERRNKKIDETWYAGVSRLSQHSGGAMVAAASMMANAETDSLGAKSSVSKPTGFGVIGDRRALRHIGLEEANGMSTAEHAAPLFQMALDSLERAKDYWKQVSVRAPVKDNEKRR